MLESPTSRGEFCFTFFMIRNILPSISVVCSKNAVQIHPRNSTNSVTVTTRALPNECKHIACLFGYSAFFGRSQQFKRLAMLAKKTDRTYSLVSVSEELGRAHRSEYKQPQTHSRVETDTLIQDAHILGDLMHILIAAETRTQKEDEFPS